MISAQKADTPRWGDYPEKLELPYLTKLIKTGQWFDGKYPLKLSDNQKDPDYAPLYVLHHFDQYQRLLVPHQKEVLMELDNFT